MQEKLAEPTCRVPFVELDTNCRFCRATSDFSVQNHNLFQSIQTLIPTCANVQMKELKMILIIVSPFLSQHPQRDSVAKSTTATSMTSRQPSAFPRLYLTESSRYLSHHEFVLASVCLRKSVLHGTSFTGITPFAALSPNRNCCRALLLDGFGFTTTSLRLLYCLHFGELRPDQFVLVEYPQSFI